MLQTWKFTWLVRNTKQKIIITMLLSTRIVIVIVYMTPSLFGKRIKNFGQRCFKSTWLDSLNQIQWSPILTRTSVTITQPPSYLPMCHIYLEVWILREFINIHNGTAYMFLDAWNYGLLFHVDVREGISRRNPPGGSRLELSRNRTSEDVPSSKDVVSF